MRRLCLALLIATSCHTAAGEAKDAPVTAPPAAVRFETPRGPWIVRVEVARTDKERARGLMFRRDLPADRGMIFLFDDTSEHAFWMHNTLISLDMIFIGEDRAVAGVVERATPRDDSPRTVGKPSRYVVEVSGGEAAAHGVGPGTRAVFIDVPE
jgi:uncharacterized membrane protein (UPF0127 family)